jgi:putative membrane protein
MLPVSFLFLYYSTKTTTVMKQLMASSVKIMLVAMLAWTLQSCGGNTGAKHDDATDSAEAVNDTTAAVDEESADFAVKAASGGMMEVQLGDISQQNANSQRVKDFGNMMVRDHSKANDELKGIAVTKNITLPDSVGEDHKKHIDDLRKKTGRDFDKAYIDMMVDDHKEDVDMFDKAANNLKDPDLKAFASRTLPTLRAHLDSARMIQETYKKQMNNSNRPEDRGK